ncbi:CRISPR-associated endoribonuclease Cas6 [Synechococcales cyanobacterium C]|uniref:CRISPR-associated endoribonuclease Cas6 n=2 Tax=Petrachloros TaxID=2918834 RepID=A0A8K2A8Y8_9CYAN|nr:CRISPR-associated endoribonuclease Cas6 [Petrachloros mirabilis ULC683]
MVPSRSTSSQVTPALNWPKTTELLGITLNLSPLADSEAYPQYVIGLHAWFLEQVRQYSPQLSQELHDNQTEKAFTLSALLDPQNPWSRTLKLQAGQVYQWQITALSRPVVQWLTLWLKSLPSTLPLRTAPLQIQNWSISHPPLTYRKLAQLPARTSHMPLSFISPTSFRHKGNHLPLPAPVNIFHSYLRRWNVFSPDPVNADHFLQWVDESVIIVRHQFHSVKTIAAKKGAVTGFVGAVEFGLSPKGRAHTDYAPLYQVLGRLAPYCGTGHKTTFGLGQTRWGWPAEIAVQVATRSDVLAQRIDQLTQQFMTQRQRQGGERTPRVSATWATILARRELGEGLEQIATDLEMPYATVKTYVKLARRALRSERA